MDFLVGRSEILDFVVALFATNMLLKAGVIGACMVAAWSWGKTPEETMVMRRRMLLVLLAAMCAVGYTKVAGRLLSYPRPIVLTQETFRFEDGRLSPYEKVSFRTPAESDGRKRVGNLQRGLIDTNDWESFPSDHAGFFGALAIGMIWVNPTIGLIATGWAFLVIFPSKLLRGLHRPSDMFAGLAVALLALFLWSLLERNGLLTRVARWTLRFNVLATALFFLVAFEAANTLNDVQDLALSARDLLRILRQ
jgi:membrane-associated phospholipid phosphatase